MKSGLEDRNNLKRIWWNMAPQRPVSMKSGLEDRNNVGGANLDQGSQRVSMKSGLEDRNNQATAGNISFPDTSQ